MQKKKHMKEFPQALSDLTETRFEGNRASLAKSAGMDRSVITKLIAGDTSPSIARLEALCAVLDLSDRRSILLAAARDLIPDNYKEEVWHAQFGHVTDMLRGALPPDVKAVLDYLERDALENKETVAFLRRIGKMIGLSPRDQDL